MTKAERMKRIKSAHRFVKELKELDRQATAAATAPRAFEAVCLTCGKWIQLSHGKLLSHRWPRTPFFCPDKKGHGDPREMP